MTTYYVITGWRACGSHEIKFRSTLELAEAAADEMRAVFAWVHITPRDAR